MPLVAASSGGGEEDMGLEAGGSGGGEGAAGSGCGQRAQGCQGSLCAGSAGLAGRNGMFPLALQEQKQLWKGLKRSLNEKNLKVNMKIKPTLENPTKLSVIVW